MEYDGFEQLVDDDEVFTFLKPAILTPGATERTHRYTPHVRAPLKQNSTEKQSKVRSALPF